MIFTLYNNKCEKFHTYFFSHKIRFYVIFSHKIGLCVKPIGESVIFFRIKCENWRKCEDFSHFLFTQNPSWFIVGCGGWVCYLRVYISDGNFVNRSGDWVFLGALRLIVLGFQDPVDNFTSFEIFWF